MGGRIRVYQEMKETRLQKIISWLYVRYVLMPKVRQGYNIKISILNDEEAEAYLNAEEWKQNTENAEMAMFQKMFEKEQ